MKTEKLTAEQKRLVDLIKAHNGKCSMTLIRGAGFSGHTINRLVARKIIKPAFMGGYYLLHDILDG
mgnify:CR=1 FL=1